MKRVPPRRGSPPADETRTARRYRELLGRHKALAARANDDMRSEVALHRLSWFALQRSTSALAMFRSGQVVSANPRWRTLASPLNGVGWIVGPGAGDNYDDLATLAATELRTVVPGEPRTLHVRRRDDTCALRVRLERVSPAGEEPIGLLLAEDITAETEREMAAVRDTIRKREQMAAIGRVAAGVAHDVGNALSALSLRVQRLERNAPDAGSEHLQAIGEAVELMRTTLERLDRIGGRRTRILRPVPLRKVIERAISLAGLHAGQRAARKKGAVVVVLTLPRKLPRVLADGNELCNVFVNLLLNARDAMPDGGAVRISASVGTRQVTVRVSDEGPGFAPEQLARVFEPFFTTKGARGGGLGLSLAYGFMESIGGSIHAGNRDGGGAELTLEFPIARAR